MGTKCYEWGTEKTSDHTSHMIGPTSNKSRKSNHMCNEIGPMEKHQANEPYDWSNKESTKKSDHMSNTLGPSRNQWRNV